MSDASTFMDCDAFLIVEIVILMHFVILYVILIPLQIKQLFRGTL